MTIRKSSWPAIFLLAASLFSIACPGAWRRAQKTPTSALWIARGSVVPELSQLAQLKELGVEELFLEAATLRAGSEEIVVRHELPELPPSTTATLVVTGAWPGSGAGELAAEVAEGLRQVRFEAESRGIVPVGFHFDLRDVGSRGAYASFLGELRGELDRTLFLSTSVPRGWIDSGDLEDVADAVDFLVAFLYGQRPDEAEDATAWDFVRLQNSLEVLEELGTPYMLGVVTLGTATRLGPRGGVEDRATQASLRQILWNRNLKLQHGFTLDGVNRQLYTLRAERPTKIADWSLRSDEAVRVVRATTFHLEELKRLMGAWEIPNALGTLYYRLPAPEERLSLTLENLLNALAPEPAAPDLAFDAVVRRRTGRGWLFEVSLDNDNGEITELSLIDNNYLQITAPEGTFGTVKVGDFYRFDLYRSEGAELVRTHRRPNVVRLYAPMLEGRQAVTSGDIELFGRGSPELVLEASFLLPNGREMRVGPYEWRDGELQTGEEEPEDPEDGEEPEA